MRVSRWEAEENMNVGMLTIVTILTWFLVDEHPSVVHSLKNVARRENHNSESFNNCQKSWLNRTRQRISLRHANQDVTFGKGHNRAAKRMWKWGIVTPMGTTNLSNEELAILYRFMGFPDFFSVDWFTVSHDLLPSRLISIISFLEKRRWISVNAEGLYEWSKNFPRAEILTKMDPLEMSGYYRDTFNTLMEHLPRSGDSALRLAKQSLLAGIQKTDVDIIFEAAMFHEKSHNIRSAIELYDYLLCYAEDIIFDKKEDSSADLCQTFIKSIKRRASLSLFHPDLKKVNRFLCLALDLAVSIGDKRSEAALQLLIGQNCWMSFQYQNAVKHFLIDG